MALLNKIKTDSELARKSRTDPVKSQLLVTLYSEAAMIGKNKGNRETTDEEVTVVLKKFLKGINEMIDALLKRLSQPAGPNLKDVDTLDKLRVEREIIESYLPERLTDDELKKVILDAISKLEGDKDIKKLGLVLKTLKAEYPDMYDTAKAAEIAKNALE